ncbi:MAG TPA: Gfo/Idh/MocA family oxidoreductase [Methylomirabilota bacterium]|nr:Gfo/Idh/MocA family oxidoreductase [Methylomirabilota bacterium]
METKPSKSSTGSENRRDFIKKTATAAAAVATTNLFRTPVYGQSTAPSTGRVIGANDRIAVAVIGVGYGIGMNHHMGIQEKAAANNVVVAAGCDLALHRRQWMAGGLELYGRKVKEPLKESDIYTDYRKLLERKDIDAVVVATHDTWHAKVSIDAMEAGKHVYCEKPMTRYLDEAFRIHDTVKRTGRVFTVGSQGCSADGWHKAAEMIKAGKIGQLVWGQGYYCRNNPKGEWNYAIDAQSTAQNIDWETWLGPVKKRIPFNADHFHRWRKYYPYCSGLLGDLVPHRLHPLMLASGNPEFPVRVTSIGSKNVHTDRNTPGTPERDVPEHVQLLAQFPSGYMITVTCSTVNSRSPGFVIYGHKATLNIGDQGNVIELVPERPFTEEIEGEKLSGLQHEDIRVHEKNWFDCIRNGKQPNAGIDLAIKVQTVISLAEMSERMNITCVFDEKTRKVTDGSGKEVKPLTYGSVELS